VDVTYEAWCTYGELVTDPVVMVGSDCQSAVYGSITITCRAQQHSYYQCTYDNLCPQGLFPVPIDQSTMIEQTAVSEPWNVTRTGGYFCGSIDGAAICAGSSGNPIETPNPGLPEDVPNGFLISLACVSPGTCSAQWASNDRGRLYCNITQDNCTPGFSAGTFDIPPRGSDYGNPGPSVGDPCSCTCM
jgi:hypothetical protein